MVRDNFGSASGRPVKAYVFIGIAEQPAITYDELHDSGDFESIDCKLAAALKGVLNHDLRYQIKNLTAKEHAAGRMLKGRQIYWHILQH